MSESWLNFLVTWGQIGVIVFSILAGICGAVSGLAGKGLSSQSDEKLAKLQTQVAAVIGDIWDPLTVKQVENLRQKIENWRAPAKIQIMYQNKFGKDLAESIATAFRAAKWEVTFTNMGGSEQGIIVGLGHEGPNLKNLLASVLPDDQITATNLDYQGTFYTIGVGAKE